MAWRASAGRQQRRTATMRAECALAGAGGGAQVRWGHWLLAHAASWQRDDMRLTELLPRVATLPLGSGDQDPPLPPPPPPRTASRAWGGGAAGNHAGT